MPLKSAKCCAVPVGEKESLLNLSGAGFWNKNMLKVLESSTCDAAISYAKMLEVSQ